MVVVPRNKGSSGNKPGNSGGSRPLIRPTSLVMATDKLRTRTVPAPESFPTPMEEPRKVLKAMFLGQIQVAKPCGMDVVNEAIDNLVNEVPRADWKMVSVSVAPSTITINFTDGLTAPCDCRVRLIIRMRTLFFVQHIFLFGKAEILS